MDDTRNIKIDNKYYKIPSFLNILYVNGIPFAHFLEGNLECDFNIMNDYSIYLEEMPYECPDYLKEYIKSNFKEVILW